MKDKEIQCWGIQVLTMENDWQEVIAPILEEAKDMKDFVGAHPIAFGGGVGGILLFTDKTSRNRAFLELKKFNSVIVQVIANFKPAMVPEKDIKRGMAA